jgi:hypothetical protein
MRKQSPKTLKNKADKVFSEYIRRSHADEGGTVSCVSCGKLMFWKESQCGHYVKRQYQSLRYDIRNAAPQCARCNMFLGGAMDEFAVYLTKKYGHEILDELASLKRQVVKRTRADWEALIELYKSKLAGLGEGA